MLLARVQGQATSTVKHTTMSACKLLVALELDRTGKPGGDPLMIIDKLGAGIGDLVMISSDGKGVAERLGDEKTPVRWFTLGIVDF
jgi:ethanolamine utilization protein EutN